MRFWGEGRAGATTASTACAFQQGPVFPAQCSLSMMELLHQILPVLYRGVHASPLPTFGHLERCWTSAMPGKVLRSCGCSASLPWSPWAGCISCQRPHCAEAGELKVLLEGSTASQWQRTMIPSPMSSFSFPLLTTHSDSKEMGAAGWDHALSFISLAQLWSAPAWHCVPASHLKQGCWSPAPWEWGQGWADSQTVAI